MMKSGFRGMCVLMAALTLGLAGCANSGEKTGAYVDDSWITTKVKSELANKEVSSRNISVNTTRGVVMLTGTAATALESTKAADIAQGVKGVTRVENDIRVQ